MPSIYTASAVPQRYMGKCKICNRPVSAPLDASGNNPDHKQIRCPDCGNMCKASLLFGKVNLRMDCDDRCMGAYGSECSCACGGVNHGGVWSETLDNVPVEALKRFRADSERREKQAEDKRKKDAQKYENQFNEWIKDNPEAKDILDYDQEGERYNYFIWSLQEQLKEKSYLSERQISAGIKAVREQQAKFQARTNQTSKSEYQGEIGEKLTKVLTIDHINWVEDHYAQTSRGQEIPTKPMYIMHDAEGNVYVWFASSARYAFVKVQGAYSAQDVAKAGDTLKIQAQVKNHSEYNGTKQTILTRAKVIFD